ncbi:MAG: hypothetical protein NTZ74_16070 [Chloroflexi bacterium]|nr:hypothetical protein [Chloroflexota bacterium]
MMMTGLTQPIFGSKNNFLRLCVLLTLVFVMLCSVFNNTSAAGVPVIYIGTINQNLNVTISGVNFPVGEIFTVRMGAFGTLGIGGTIVGTQNTVSGSTFTTTFTIPVALVGASKIAIRFDSPDGYYSYNWFYNNPTSVSTPVIPAATAIPGYYGTPTFTISTVQQGVSVTILTNNFPAGQPFTVRMGEFGTLGIGGIVVDTTNSGTGGSFSKTYTIPASLASLTKIAIRMDCPLGYYAFNWFFNNTAPVAATTAVPSAISSYVGIPTFFINSVVKDASVSIAAYNFPPGQVFTVRMGEFGTLGVGGTVITTIDSGAGGNFSATYAIPAWLSGRSQIAIRIESASGYYYAYNWFYNN